MPHSGSQKESTLSQILTSLAPSHQRKLEDIQPSHSSGILKHSLVVYEAQFIYLFKSHWDTPLRLIAKIISLCLYGPFCQNGSLGIFQGLHCLVLLCIHRCALAVSCTLLSEVYHMIGFVIGFVQ